MTEYEGVILLTMVLVVIAPFFSLIGGELVLPRERRRQMHLGKMISFFDPRLAEWLSIKLKLNTIDLMGQYRVRKWW